MSDNGAIILYQSEDGEIQIEVQLNKSMVWLTLDQMAKLFQRDKSVVSRHIKNVYEEGEKKVAREIEYYNLDMIISVVLKCFVLQVRW